MGRRPFRALRTRGPARRYDVVVVGAGIGGLVCATLLAKEGLKALLVEQHYMVGGYCSTFRRGGYTFDASTHFYPLLGNPGTMPGRLLRELGVEVGWVRMDPVDTFHLPDGTSFVVPADFETYRRRLDERFPASRAALDGFFDDVREAYNFGTLYYFRGRDNQQLDRWRERTLREVLDERFDDPALKLVLTADVAHWGSPPSRTSFVFDSMLRLSYFLGNYYPEGGSQVFADALAARFEALGGDILMSTRVRRIEVEGGRVLGIRAETTRGPLRGEWAIESGTVVSNADLLLTLEELLGREVVGEETIARVRSLRPTFPCYLTHLGLSGVDAETLARVQGYYWRSWDADRVGRDGLRCKVFVPTLYAPEMAPPGRHVVILQKVVDEDPSRIADWPRHKERMERLLLGEWESILPGVTDRIEVRSTASAATARRFTLNHQGAMLGWEMSPAQLGPGRPGILGPVEGVVLTGHWVRPGGGITPVIVSAQEAARAVLAAS
ncbi:MAG: NAD(P)/FAD-dependent oxidoreductase [Thermoanaerobaculia bacterium]